MTVSIITVVYNGAETVAEAIESVLEQTYPTVEYIVIDGGSTDGTQAIVQRYGARISQFVSEPDGGLYEAMNKGLSRATGEVVGILNADDLYRHPDTLSRIMATFAAQKADAVYGDLVYSRRDAPNRVMRYWQAGRYRPGAFLRGWMPPHPTFFVKTDVYRKYGYFNTNLRTAADYELMLRLVHKHTIRVAYLNEVVVVMRLGGVSNSSLKNRLRANREDRIAWKLNKIRPGVLTLWLKPLRKLGQFWHRRQPTVR